MSDGEILGISGHSPAKEERFDFVVRASRPHDSTVVDDVQAGRLHHNNRCHTDVLVRRGLELLSC